MPLVIFHLAPDHPAVSVTPRDFAFEVNVVAGTRLLDAAAQCGAPVPTQCGGVLACLACQVTIQNPSALAPAGLKERACLDECGAASDARFACHARVLDDVVVILPKHGVP